MRVLRINFAGVAAWQNNRAGKMSVTVAEHDFFDADYYLRTRFTNLGAMDRELHELFQTLPSSGELKVLDFGCGLVIQHCISAAAHAAEVVFCESNRAAIQKWLSGDKDAFNWSPHFDYVVKTLEGNGEKEAREREEKLRKIAKVAYCDVLSPTPMEKGFEGPYDVLIEYGCLDAACSDLESYKTCVKNMAPLVKPGGVLVRASLNGKSNAVYDVGDRTFPCIRMTDQGVCSFRPRRKRL